MQLVFSDQPLPLAHTRSVFLAGPSPRSPEIPDWRPQALEVLQRAGFDGTVLIPIPEARFSGSGGNEPGWSYTGQVEWEAKARARADVIVFWVPRVLDTSRADLGMPGFTTNFEMGEDLTTAKVLYGRPGGAAKTAYLDQKAREYGLQVHDSLESVLGEALAVLGSGAYREGGEADVPLFVWRSAAFQSWYASLKAAGNRLDGASVLGHVILGRGFLFSFTLKVKVWVASEQRHKSNEIIIARPDTSAVLATYRDPSAGVLKVILVREFRSPVNNERGFVYELPAGSSTQAGMDPQLNAQHELEEETGLRVEDLRRFKRAGRRQLAATFSVHRAELYAIELTPKEFAQLQATAQAGQPCGEEARNDGASGERTYVEVASLDELFTLPLDYATLGMVAEGLRTLEQPFA